MASTQKRSGASPKGGSAKQTTKKPSAARSGGRGSGPSRSKPPAYLPDLLARGVGAGVCLFLALLVSLGVLGVHGAIPDLLCRFLRGLAGSGFWLVIPALVWAAGLLLLRRDRPIPLRLWCVGLLPVAGGAFLHVVLAGADIPSTEGLFRWLWEQGIEGPGGGVFSGLLGVLFTVGFSRLGAGLILVLLLLVLVAGASHLTLRKIRAAWARFQDYRETWYEDDEEEYRYREEDDYDPRPPRRRPPRPRRDEDPYGAGAPPIVSSPPPYDGPPPVTESAPADRPAFWSRWGRKKAPDLPLDDPAPSPQDTRQEAEPWAEEPVPPPPPSDDLPDPAPVFDPPPADPMWQTTAAPEPSEPEPPLVVPAPTVQTVPPPPAAPAAPVSKAQRQQDIAQAAQAVEQTVRENLEEPARVYQYPALELLTPPSGESAQAAHQELEGTLERLASVLNSFGIDGHVTGAVQGPSVTRYEVALEQGVRLNKLTNLSDDVALALGVSNVRIAPVPGKISVVGIEVPNKVVIPVPIREVLSSPAFQRHKSSVAFSVGKDIGGNYIVGDCSKLPHMLIAGTTGSGKSVCINSLLISMLYKSTPQELRLIMVDPKMVELGGYNGIPHLLVPVVTDPKKAAGALQWAVTEMMKRYRLFAEAGVRELSSYNRWAEGQEGTEPMPKVVIVIDELADLMLVAAKEVEESICRVAQMGRAAGMHLVIATQRPSADVITGLMKANIPSRIAFAVASSLESRIILDSPGAEKLVGKGDMLWYPLGAGKPLRVQGCFISDEEVAAVVESVKENADPSYDNEVMAQIEQHVTESEKKGKSSGGFPGGDGPGEEQDEHFEAGVEVILELGQASVSMLQRRLKLGYARAARLMDQIEEKGIVGPSEGAKPRQILITKEQWEQMKNGQPPEAPPPVEDELLSFDPIPQEYEP